MTTRLYQDRKCSTIVGLAMMLPALATIRYHPYREDDQRARLTGAGRPQWGEVISADSFRPDRRREAESSSARDRLDNSEERRGPM
jgi:hypothetical protein